ncbi:MAG: hypothetical protein ABGZ35_33500 [Planctomycetaceae bacterium]
MSLWNGFLGLLLLIVCASGRCVRAQESSLVEIPEATLPQKILVLKKHGRVVKGDIRSRGNGYEIDQRNGQLFIASDEVWLLADSLPEAHQSIRDSFSSLTPEIHMRIASWCASNQLWGTAQSELLDALHKDPYREEARRMLAKVVRLQDAATGSHPAGDSSAVTDAIASRMVVSRRSLGGLSSKLARDFTRQIQPVLFNKCAGCHDVDSDRTFSMESIRTGSTPEIAERNLTSILDQLDPAGPNDGDFFKMARTRHGSMNAVPFSRRSGEIQLDRLSSWIESVRLEKEFATAQRPPGSKPPQINSGGSVRRAAHQTQQHRDSAVRSAEFVVPDSDPHESIRAAGLTASEMLVDANRRNRIDRFDPGVFNQQYRARTEPVDASSRLTSRRSP